jgi:hypothetical protein
MTPHDMEVAKRDGPRWRRGLRLAIRFRILLYVALLLWGLGRFAAWHTDFLDLYSPVFYRDRLAYCRANEWDLAIVGGSPTMCAVDAELLAGLCYRGNALPKAINLGLPLATVVEVCHGVEHGLSDHPPKLLVYCVAPTDLNGNRFEPQGARHLMGVSDALRWSRLRPEKIRWLVEHAGRERSWETWPLAYHAEAIRLAAAEWMEERWPDFCPEAAAQARENVARSAVLRSPRGLAPAGDVASDSRYSYLRASGRPIPAMPWLEAYDPEGHLPYLNLLLDWGETHRVPIILVELPFVSDIETTYAAELAAFRRVLQTTAAKRNVTLLQPTRGELGIDDADFADQPHLNADGMCKFSRWLRRALEPLNAVEARR